MEKDQKYETEISSLGAALTRKITEMMRHPMSVPEALVLEELLFNGPEAADKLVGPGSTQLINFKNPVTGVKAWLEMPVPGSRPLESEGMSRWGLTIDVPIGARHGAKAQLYYYIRIDEATYATSIDAYIFGDVGEDKNNELFIEIQNTLGLNEDQMSEFANGEREFSQQIYDLDQHAEVMKLLNSFRPEHEVSDTEIDS